MSKLHRHSCGIALALLSASSAPRPAWAGESAAARIGEAEQQLFAGHLTEAARLARAAVEADPSDATFGARQILFEVALRQGALPRAADIAKKAGAMSGLIRREEDWLERAERRLRCAAAQGSGDVRTAETLLVGLRAERLDRAEQDWVEAEARRVVLRTAELAINLEMLARASETEGFSLEDRTWMDGTLLRASVRQAVQTCDAEEAWSALERLGGLEGLWSPDARWADLERERLAVLETVHQGNWSAAIRRLDALSARQDLDDRERTSVDALVSALDRVQEGKNPPASMDAPACWFSVRARSGPRAEARVVVGGGFWSQGPVEGSEDSLERWYPDQRSPEVAVGGAAGFAWPFLRSFGLAGEVGGGLAIGASPWLDTWAGPGWIGKRGWFAVGPGARSTSVGRKAEMEKEAEMDWQVAYHVRAAGGLELGPWALAASAGWGSDVIPLSLATSRQLGLVRAGIEARGALAWWEVPVDQQVAVTEGWLGATVGMVWGGVR